MWISWRPKAVLQRTKSIARTAIVAFVTGVLLILFGMTVKPSAVGTLFHKGTGRTVSPWEQGRLFIAFMEENSSNEFGLVKFIKTFGNGRQRRRALVLLQHAMTHAGDTDALMRIAYTLRHTVNYETWPYYEYVVTRLLPEKCRVAVAIPFGELARRGFGDEVLKVPDTFERLDWYYTCIHWRLGIEFCSFVQQYYQELFVPATVRKIEHLVACGYISEASIDFMYLMNADNLAPAYRQRYDALLRKILK